METLNLNEHQGQLPKIKALVKKIKDVYILESTFNGDGFHSIVVGHRLLSMLCESNDFKRNDKIDSNRQVEAGTLFEDAFELKVILDTNLPWEKPQVHFLKENRNFTLDVIYDK